LGALAFGCAFLLLGSYVKRTRPGWPDTLAPYVFGRGVGLARVFTISGYARWVGVVLAASLGLALAAGASFVPVVVVASVQAASQIAVSMVKLAYRRARPEDWRFKREMGLSYPSGHATTAVVVYGMLLWLAYHDVAPAPLRYASVCALALWSAGICWSRIALGAHYPTDVLGGALFGAAFALGGIALLH
jgi:undecaprenyl-diphosphatase